MRRERFVLLHHLRLQAIEPCLQPVELMLLFVKNVTEFLKQPLLVSVPLFQKRESVVVRGRGHRATVVVRGPARTFCCRLEGRQEAPSLP